MKKMLLSVLVSIFVSGCLQSKNPLYSDDVGVELDSIVGTYSNELRSDSATYEISKSNNARNGYIMTIRGKDSVRTHKFRLVKLGIQVYADIQEGSADVHDIVRVVIKDGDIITAELPDEASDVPSYFFRDDDHRREYYEKFNEAMDYLNVLDADTEAAARGAEKLKGNSRAKVLTSVSTKKLQRFAAKYPSLFLVPTYRFVRK